MADPVTPVTEAAPDAAAVLAAQIAVEASKQADTKAVDDKVAADKVVADKAAADKVIEDKAAAEKAANEKTLSDAAAATKAAEAKVEADKKIADEADKLAAAKAKEGETKTDAEKAAELKAKEGDNPTAKDLDKSVWGDTGSETGNAVLAMLSDAGLTPEDAKSIMFDAVLEGDMSKLDTAKLEEKLGKNQAFLAANGIRSFIKEQAAASEAAVKAAHEVVGGEDNWAKVRDYSNETATEEQMDTWSEMINKGGTQRKFALTEMRDAYNGDSKNSTLAPARETADDMSTSPAPPPLGKAAYVVELEKVERDRSLSYAQKQSKMAAINAVRARARAAGH